MDFDYETIVVGAGTTGGAAALKLAQAGSRVLLVDRGDPIGSKNMSGGVLWGNDLGELLPAWQTDAPIERPITTKRIAFLTQDDAMNLEFRFPEWGRKPYNGVSVLRARFDPWLAGQVEEAGGDVFPGINVLKLKRDAQGRCVGIIQDEGKGQEGDEVTAPVVIIADGINSRLSFVEGYRQKPPPEDLMIGVKEIYRADPKLIEDRFALDPGTGAACEHVLGHLGPQVRAGGFLYTNKDTISLGIVVQFESIMDAKLKVSEMMTRYKEHPYIQALIRDLELVEYGAHWIPEGGYRMVPERIHDDGVMIAGDAAGLCFSNGMVIQGMNMGIHSGILAAKAAIKAKEKGDFSAATLSVYRQTLDDSYVIKDLKAFAGVHKVTKNPRVFHGYPQMINGIAKRMMTEDGKGKTHVHKLLREAMKQHGISYLSLLKDGLGGLEV